MSDVCYSRIYGLFVSDDVVMFNCNVDLGCEDIVMDYVDIVLEKVGYVVLVFCKNVCGSYFSLFVSCIKKY